MVGLDVESVGLVFDMLEQRSYDILKEHLIWLPVSETTKLNYLLTELTLPSQLLREMKQEIP